MSSVAAYGDGLNHAEDDPLASDMHRMNMSATRLAASVLFSACSRVALSGGYDAPAVCLRPGKSVLPEAFFLGPNYHRPACDYSGDGNRLMQFVYVNDLVEACFNALTKHTAPAVRSMWRTTNHSHRLRLSTSSQRLRASRRQWCGYRATSSPAMVVTFLIRRYTSPSITISPPITEAVGRVKRVLNVAMTRCGWPQETYKWYLRHSRRRHLDFSFEDKLIKQAKEVTRPAHSLEISGAPVEVRSSSRTRRSSWLSSFLDPLKARVDFCEAAVHVAFTSSNWRFMSAFKSSRWRFMSDLKSSKRLFRSSNRLF